MIELYRDGDGMIRRVKAGDPVEEGWQKIGEETATEQHVLERKSVDEIALDAAATRLREVIALMGGTGRAPTRQHALVRSKAEEALLYALFGTYTGIDAT